MLRDTCYNSAHRLEYVPLYEYILPRESSLNDAQIVTVITILDAKLSQINDENLKKVCIRMQFRHPQTNFRKLSIYENILDKLNRSLIHEAGHKYVYNFVNGLGELKTLDLHNGIASQTKYIEKREEIEQIIHVINILLLGQEDKMLRSVRDNLALKLDDQQRPHSLELPSSTRAPLSQSKKRLGGTVRQNRRQSDVHESKPCNYT